MNLGEYIMLQSITIVTVMRSENTIDEISIIDRKILGECEHIFFKTKVEFNL